jgi:hypothetical protein
MAMTSRPVQLHGIIDMWDWLGKIFGTDKALSGIVDGVSNGLDKLVYTDEEKAGDAATERAAARRAVIEWMETTKGQNLARRLIALSITFAWLMQYLAAWFMNLVAVFLDDPEAAEKLREGAVLTSANGERMVGAVMLILAFYFAAPHMGKLVSGAMTKFASDNVSKKE